MKFTDLFYKIQRNVGQSDEKIAGQLMYIMGVTVPINSSADYEKMISLAEQIAQESNAQYVGAAHYIIASAGVEMSALYPFLRHIGTKGVNAIATRFAQQEGLNIEFEATFGWGDDEGEEDEEGTEFLTDMVALANSDSKPFIGRKKELDELVLCLERMDKPSAILAGPAGVGKTDIVRGLAKKIADGDVEKGLKDVRLYNMDVAGMLAGTSLRGQFEERLKAAIEYIVAQTDRPIVFIDEIHTVIGCGNSSGSMDAAQILKPYLTGGKLRIVGATTDEEFRKFVERDAAFMRRFMKIAVNEPSVEDAIEIIVGSKSAYEKFHGVKISKACVKEAVNLSAKYMHDRYLPDKAIDIVDMTMARCKIGNETKVTEDDIQETLSELCHIPVSTFSEKEVDKVRGLDKKIKASVFGQDEAVKVVSDAVQMSKVGLNDPNKPIGSFLFVGPSGVGKTELAKKLAESLDIGFIRFDMSEYMEPHSVSKLIGAPAGYVGYNDGGQLVEAIRKTPHCVLLFDEIEKAHPDVFKIFLQILDYGMLTESHGKKADFRNTVIIMTSNAGNTTATDKHVGFTAKSETKFETSMKAISAIMPPELRGRIDKIVQFNPLNDEVSIMIVKKELKTLTARLKALGIKATFTEDALMAIKELGVSKEYGARAIQGVINSKIKPLFKDAILDGLNGEVVVDFKCEFTLERKGE